MARIVKDRVTQVKSLPKGLKIWNKNVKIKGDRGVWGDAVMVQRFSLIENY